MTDQEILERFGPALERLDGDIDLLCQMAAVTAPDCQYAISQFRNTLDLSEGEDAAKTLHKLKGMLSTFDTDGVVIEIQEMLEQARRGKLNVVKDAFDRHENKIEQAIDDIRELAESR